MKDDIKRPDAFRDAKNSIDSLLATLLTLKHRLEDEQRKADRTAIIVGLLVAFTLGFLLAKLTS